MSMKSHAVVGVLSGCGGAGASVLSALLAASVSAAPVDGTSGSGHVTLIDCDPLGGGIDVLLGCEQVAGPRWRQVRVKGGRLDAAVLEQSLPRWGQVAFLAADSSAIEPPALEQVIGAARELGPVVLDIPRWPGPVRSTAIAHSDLLVLVAVAEVRAITASRLIIDDLPADRTVVAVRGRSRSVSSIHIGELLDRPVIGEVSYDPALAQSGVLDQRRIGRASRRLLHSIAELIQDDDTSLAA